MCEANKYSERAKDKLLIRKKSSVTETVLNETGVGRNRTSEGKGWNATGRGFKALPKSLAFVKCCKPSTLSIDESSEEENCTITKAMGHSSLCHNAIEGSVEEDARLSCIQDGFLRDANQDIDKSSWICKCKGLECDSINFAKGHRRSLDHSKYFV